MIQASGALRVTEPSDGAGKAPRIWGLSAAELHEAFWRASGVQCIRRGQVEPLQAGADLFLLIEPDQLVLFDVRAIAERLAWRAACVTRVRVAGQAAEENYGEHVVMDDCALVERISRRYRPQTHAAYRVLLTRNRRVAKIWMTTESRRAGWRRIRKIAGASNIDVWRSPGRCFSLHQDGDAIRFIDALVPLWSRPDRSLHGIVEIADNVWGLPGESIDEGEIIIGPTWLGNSRQNKNACLVGPAWLADEFSDSSSLVRVRNILDVEPGEIRSRENTRRPSRTAYAVAKRTFDLVVSGIGLLALSPVLVLIALCIWREDGRPVLYRQSRQSRGGREFGCWKFRTMCRDADAIKAQLAEDNVCDGPQFYVQDDPRVTRVGRVLRRLYLDELPQLWNVLIGDMSLVGPRPSPENENRICPAWRELRLSVRPGLTGLWQLNRTRQPGTDFQEWIKFDVEYLERASFLFDMHLLARTFLALLRRR